MKLLANDRPLNSLFSDISINDAPTLILDPDPVSPEVQSTEPAIGLDLAQQAEIGVTQFPEEIGLC
ncbi:MAG: hypothetical protein NW224_07825 [Leptolyngbyaceae cyanobacterium bins.302]|nr:hypothetical protein [Leptolyngbyaceae cyanobacterium bins.302]